MNHYNKHLIITGTARSGTSWLSETISRQHRYRLLFEPEHETRTKNGVLLCDQWLKHSENLPKAKKYLTKILQNRVDCDWIAQNSNRTFKRHLWPFIPKKYIIKFVRGNLFGKYIVQEYRVPVVHIIRNPYDVLNSQKRSSFPWLQDLRIFSNQKKLVELVDKNYGLNLNSLNNFSVIQLRAIRWCIENVLPIELLEYQKNDLYHIVRYEDLFSNVSIFLELCALVNIEPLPDIELYYRKPSTKTHKDSSLVSTNPSKKLLSTSEIKSISEILSIFRTQLYPIES